MYDLGYGEQKKRPDRYFFKALHTFNQFATRQETKIVKTKRKGEMLLLRRILPLPGQTSHSRPGPNERTPNRDAGGSKFVGTISRFFHRHFPFRNHVGAIQHKGMFVIMSIQH